MITKKYGLATFGEVALSSSIGLFLANLVNYGTNQTAVKDISIHRNDKNKLSEIFSEIFCLRFVVFIIVVTMTTTITMTTRSNYFLLWLSVLPLIVSEIFNPLYFLIGTEKIQWISWGNIIIRALSLGLIFFISLHQNVPPFLNLILFVPLLIYYLIIFNYIIKKFDLTISFRSWRHLSEKLKDNFYVSFNGSSVILQQSIFMFAVAGVASPQSLGAYGIIDKLLGAVRQLVSAFSSAIYPRAAQLFHDGRSQWRIFRKKIQTGYALFFLLIALFIFIFANLGSMVFAHKEDPVIILFFRYFSLAPLALALNANNVLELLLEKQYKKMFDISVVVILITGLISFLVTRFFDESAIGLYPLIIESACLIVYTLFLHFNTIKSLE